MTAATLRAMKLHPPHTTLILAVLLACASGPVPLASQPIDWAEAGKPWSVFIVTEDEGGSERSARIWLVVDEGTGVIRTGDSRWWANLQRDPNCRLRVGGVDYPLRAVPILDDEERARIDHAFLAKYGWQESAFIESDRAASGDPYLRLQLRDSEPDPIPGGNQIRGETATEREWVAPEPWLPRDQPRGGVALPSQGPSVLGVRDSLRSDPRRPGFPGPWLPSIRASDPGSGETVWA